MMIKVYIGSGIRTVSSNGFTNYMNRTPEEAAKAREDVFKDFPNAVIINGSDDWYDPIYKRPKELANKFKLPLLAYYHDGISGLVYSGIVIDKKHLPGFEVDYEEAFGMPVQQHLMIYGIGSSKG